MICFLASHKGSLISKHVEVECFECSHMILARYPTAESMQAAMEAVRLTCL